MSEDAYALDMDRETPIRPGARSPKTSASGLRPQSRSSALFDFFIKQGYLWDWIFAAIFIIVNYVVPTKAIPPVRRFYESNDPTLSYPNHESTVPGSALYVLTFLWPAVVVSVVAAIFRSWVDW